MVDLGWLPYRTIYTASNGLLALFLTQCHQAELGIACAASSAAPVREKCVPPTNSLAGECQTCWEEKEALMPRLLSFGTPPHQTRSSLAVNAGDRRRYHKSSTDMLLRTVRLSLLGIAVLGEMGLLLVSLVPQSIWASYGYPAGPIPVSLKSPVAGAFYVFPVLTGLVCRRWRGAVVMAALPALIDLGIFAIAAARRVGPFYLAQDPHVASTVGTLELFVVLGALGWLVRVSLLEWLSPGKPGRR